MANVVTEGGKPKIVCGKLILCAGAGERIFYCDDWFNGSGVNGVILMLPCEAPITVTMAGVSDGTTFDCGSCSDLNDSYELPLQFPNECPTFRWSDCWVDQFDCTDQSLTYSLELRVGFGVLTDATTYSFYIQGQHRFKSAGSCAGAGIDVQNFRKVLASWPIANDECHVVDLSDGASQTLNYLNGGDTRCDFSGATMQVAFS